MMRGYEADRRPPAVRVGHHTQYIDERPWTSEDTQRRRGIWDDTWRRLPHDKDWYGAAGTFLEALLPEVRADSRVLELGVGRGQVAAELARKGPQKEVLSTDISAAAVQDLVARYPRSSWPGLAFEAADSLNLQFPPAGRFDLVFEKAGVSDIYQTNVRTLVRLLACIVTQAFEPSRGGVFVALVHGQQQKEDVAPCTRGLDCAVAARPDFNCSVEDFRPLRRSFWRWDSHLHVVVVRCGGVSQEVASQGCAAAARVSS